MFTGQYIHTSAHRSLDNMLKPWEDNLFKALKEDGYHVCAIAPRGDLFADKATEQAVDEVSLNVLHTTSVNSDKGSTVGWRNLPIGPHPS